MVKKKIKTPREVKKHARKSLSSNFTKQKKTYVLDTSAAVSKFISKLIKKGLQGKLIIPNAVMAEMENLANKGKEEGFIGLEEIANLHKIKTNFPVQIHFQGARPNEMQIRFAKSGEIDSVIRDVAILNKATLITADLVQAKTSQAYNIPVIFLKPKLVKEKKKFLFWKRKK
ncbi:MAG: PIN domain-containing protein [Nanoarchaeota archaeon]